MRNTNGAGPVAVIHEHGRILSQRERVNLVNGLRRRAQRGDVAATMALLLVDQQPAPTGPIPTIRA